MRDMALNAWCSVCIFSIHISSASMLEFSCDMTRSTGYADHRTLNVPPAFWDSATGDDLAWAEKLCCVFTWVVRDSSATTPNMITYDGGRRDFQNAVTIADAAELAYSAICRMSMGGRDCASAVERCRMYDPVGMLCRPKNGDGYSISTRVSSASACRDKCNADPTRCGAFEYEYVQGDDRECELHEKGSLSAVETAATGACMLSTDGGDPMDDAPVFGQYRCCWMLNTATGAATSSISTTPITTTTTSLILALASLTFTLSHYPEASATASSSFTQEQQGVAPSTTVAMASAGIHRATVALVLLLLSCQAFM